MTVIALVFAALSIVAPRDGESVSLLKDGHKAYLGGKRAERFIRMDNPSDRAKLFAMGAVQPPVRLAWNGDTNAVYRLTIAADGDAEESFAISNRNDIYVTNLKSGSRYSWCIGLEGGEESATASFVTEPDVPRMLRAGGVSNFRDLGGWSVIGGGRVRENMIFRSAGLRTSSKSVGGFIRRRVELGERRVTDAGIATLRDEFHIRTDLELRTPQETAGMNGTVLGEGVRWACISFAAYDFIDNAVRGREPFAEIFRIFTKEENYPVLMHCSGGRDRTGTLAFILNGLLGVSEDDLCRDWESSIFSDKGIGFSSDRIQRLLDYLHKLPGDGLQAKIETYVRGCGISDDEIAAFRALMIEGKAQ